MRLYEYKQGSVICTAGEPLEELVFITKGSAQAAFGGRILMLEQGDGIGLSSLASAVHGFTITAATDVAVFSFPYYNFGDLLPLLRDNTDAANRLVTSICRQMANLLALKSKMAQEAHDMYDLAKTAYPRYKELCATYAFAAKSLPGFEDFAPPPDPVEGWLSDFYTEISRLDSISMRTFFGVPGIAFGFIHKCAEDITIVHQACENYLKYIASASALFLNEGGHDLFSLISELHVNSVGIKGADGTIEALMLRINDLLRAAGTDIVFYQVRLDKYNENLASSRNNNQTSSAASISGAKQNLAGSMQLILEYAECSTELNSKFVRDVARFTRVPDRNSGDDDIYALRKQLTNAFYEIYTNALIKSMEDKQVPTVVKMLLNFGYIDADLAGLENAEYLYSIADSFKGDAELGVYTASEWMAAIYNGKKEPSRNDFDEDYTEYVRDLKNTNKITETEAKILLVDPKSRLQFELEHVFPVVNKITFGRMSTYCPLFSDANVQRKLETSLTRPETVLRILEEIRQIDFSAYTRETMYSNDDVGITKENINVEALPDFILTPTLGLRGTMWQEIEGRKRTSKSRMFLPVFLMEDLKSAIIRLTAEFRWEMCKRIQGVRWNDMTDPSLTSEYFDYLQFYRTNRDLSSEVKATVKAELLRAKNVYKAVFVNNYTDWLLYESNGSPRLNKHARKVLFQHCPFSAEIREKLATSPQYNDVLKQYKLKLTQKEKRLSNVIQKVVNAKKDVPQELLDELEFLKK